MGNLLTFLLEVIGNGVDNLPVSQEEMRILQGTALEEIGPCHMVLEQEDAVIVSVIDTAILFQESETPRNSGFQYYRNALGSGRKRGCQPTRISL